MTQQYIVNQYIFNKTAKTITLPNLPNAQLEGFQLVTNLTTGTLIYQFNNAALGGTLSGNVLTLDYDTSAMADTDILQILYNPPTGGFFDRALALLYQAVEYLRAPAWVVPAPTTREQKVNCLLTTDSSINTVSAVSAVASITNLVNFNTVDSRELVWSMWDTEYNTGIRNKIV